MTQKTKGRSRRRDVRLSRHVREGMKRFLALAVCLSLVWSGIPNIPALASSDTDTETFSMTYDDLSAKIEKAVAAKKTVKEDKYEFDGSAEEDYEELFENDGLLYEISPKVDKDGKGKLTLKVFARIDDEQDTDDYKVTGNEQIIFLLLNGSEEDQTARIVVDKYYTDEITVASKYDINPVAATVAAPGAVVTGDEFVIELTPDEGEEVTEETEAETDEAEIEAEAEADAEDAKEDVQSENDAVDEAPAEEPAEPADTEGSDEVADDADQDDDTSDGPSYDPDKDADDEPDNSDYGPSMDNESKDDDTKSDAEPEKDDSGSDNEPKSDNESKSDNEPKDDNDEKADSEKDYDTENDQIASISINKVNFVTTSLADIEKATPSEAVEEAADTTTEDTTYTTIDSVAETVTEEDDEDEDEDEDAGYTRMEGMLYDDVEVNDDKNAVAYVITLSELAEEGIEYTASADGIEVTVKAPEGALPEDAELVVVRYAEDSEEYADAADAIGLAEDNKNMIAVDISFVVDGEEVEPEKDVQVTIDASEALPNDADVSTLKVTHLEEKNDKVKPVVVANKKKGQIDEDKAIVKFSVEKFSTFTVEWNDGTGTSITVHVYNINGTSIDEELDEESYLIADNGTITISEIVNHLEQNVSYTSTYNFAYATIYYETSNNQGGFDPYTIGDEDNSVTQISKSGTNYTVTYGTNSTTTLNDPYVVTIHLYYSLPTVTLTATENTDGTVGFTTEGSYFTGDTSDAVYRWALNDDAHGSITPGENGTATFTWSEGAVAGDQVSVIVTMTVGDETASDTYTLTYGTESTTITVTLNGTAQANANVALVDTYGNTVATGKTGDEGTVTLDVIPGTYTVGVTYVTYNSTASGSTTRYTNSGTVTVGEDGIITGDTTVDLTTSVTSGPNNNTNGSGSGTWSNEEEYYYEHIDVKVAVAEGAEDNAEFSDLDRVYVYDQYGNLIYYSLDLVENDDTTDYNGLFDVNGTEGHSLVISSRDTIILVFEVYQDGEYKTYTETITPSATYPAGEYYSYSDVNAYQLYNSMNGTNISESDWETALNNGTLQELLGDGYDSNGINIGGLSFIQVADYLCDTRGTAGQAGLDFVIDVGLISVLYETYDLQIAKSLENATDYVENLETKFEFTLQELSSVSDSTSYTEAVWDTVNNALGDPASALTGELTKENDGTWSAIANFGDFLEYEAEEGTTLFYYVLSEKDSDIATAEVQYYGLKVSVEYSSTTGIATVTASYCELEKTETDGVYNRRSGWTGLTAYTGEDEEGGEYTYYSIPFVNTYNATAFNLKKVDDSGNTLDGAVFTMTTTQIEGEGETLYFTSGPDGGGAGDIIVYTLASSTTEDASTDISISGEYIRLEGMAAGTYTLTETKSPEGYASVGNFTVTITENNEVTVSGNSNVIVSQEEGSYIVIVTDNAITNIAGEKTWVDENNKNYTRPDFITINLLADGEAALDENGKAITAEVTEADGWSWSFTDLPKYQYQDDGITEIEYTITEVAVPDYNTEINGYDVTNTLVEPKMTKEVDEDDYERKEEDGERTDDMHDGEDTSGGGWGSWDDADNNQEITYHLKLTDLKGVYNLTVHDYLEDGLDFEEGTVEIVLVDGENQRDLVEYTDYVLTEGDCSQGDVCAMENCTFEIHFDTFEENSLYHDLTDLFVNVSSDAYLVITYKALTDTSVEDYVDYEDDIQNAACMTYGVTALRSSIVVYAETDLFGFDVYKYAVVNGNEIVLDEAEFILERDGKYATYTSETNENTGDAYYLIDSWVDDKDSAGTLVSGSDGMIRIEGLDDDTYTLIETKAKSGYEIAYESITIVIDEDGNVTVDGSTGSKESVTDSHVVNVENTSSGDGGGGGGNTGDLTISKTVTGSGSTTRDFDFTVDFTGGVAGGTYDVVQNDEVIGQITFDADGNASYNFTLKHGESITIKGLPEGVAYTVSEASVDGYTTTSEAASGTIGTGTTSVSYINDRATTTYTSNGGGRDRDHDSGSSGGSSGGSGSGSSGSSGSSGGDNGESEGLPKMADDGADSTLLLMMIGLGALLLAGETEVRRKRRAVKADRNR